VAAPVEVAPPPKLPCPTCMPTSPAICWQCVGSVGSGQYERGGATLSSGSAAESGGGGSRVVLCHCLALWASCRIGAAWHHWHLHGVGLAGAWVWGSVTTCPAWSGPGWCRGHWCGLAAPRNIEVIAASGDAVYLRPWGQLGRVLYPGTSSRGCCGLVCHVSCVMVACCHGLGFCVTWRLGWVSASMAGATNNTPHRSPPGGASPVVSYMPHISQMRGKGCGDSSVSFGAFGTCQTMRS
jgi:hypothetical protein